MDSSDVVMEETDEQSIQHGGDELVESSKSICDVPEPILEYILSHVSPYKDLTECRLVSRNWCTASKNAIKSLTKRFLTHDLLQSVRLEWTHFKPSLGPTISARYSHSACFKSPESMYVFGGCTVSSTTFNDLWRFDLSKRSWFRPLATGTYPPPKACASMLHWRGKLIIFGGWSHGTTSSHVLRHDSQIYNQVHIFDISLSRWSTPYVLNPYAAPSLAGHTALIIADHMLVYGGLRTVGDHQFVNASPSTELFIFSLQTGEWMVVPTSEPRPRPRYGHSMLQLSDKFILMMGGCGGPNNLMTDIWLLEIGDLTQPTGTPWKWTRVQDNSPPLSHPNLTFHQACRVNDVILVVNKSRKPSASSQCSTGKINQSKTFNLAASKVPCFPSTSSQDSTTSKVQPQSNHEDQPLASTSHQASSSSNLDSSLLLASRKDRKREKQLKALKEMEEKIRRKSLGSDEAPETCLMQVPKLPVVICSKTTSTSSNSYSQNSNSRMVLHALSVNEILREGQCRWMQVHSFPDETPHSEWLGNDFALYSLIAGRAEVILFGGVQRRQGTCFRAGVMSNSVHVIQAQKTVN